MLTKSNAYQKQRPSKFAAENNFKKSLQSRRQLYKKLNYIKPKL
jgi:hypothetical protein